MIVYVCVRLRDECVSSYTIIWPVVLADDHQPVHVQGEHQQVLNGKEDQHLVEDSEMDEDNKPDHQERPVVDEQGLNNSPQVCAVLGK